MAKKKSPPPKSKKSPPPKSKKSPPPKSKKSPRPKSTVPSISCSIKFLPESQWIEAAKKAVEINPSNAPALHQLRAAAPGAVIEPAHLALLTSKYFGVAGVRLTVSFMDNPAANLRTRILSHMNAWSAFANVKFTETAGTGQVRIARTAGSGYWSYLGTDVLSIAANKATMNLDSFTMNTPESEFVRLVRHETGHTLGFPHEHMRSDIVNKIDRNKAIAHFKATYGWPDQKTIDNVLTPLNNSALLATAQADPNSVMCYWLPASIMKNNTAIPGGANIDSQDAQFASSVYPKRSWAYEGIQCYVYNFPNIATVPLHRYWNAQITDHFYTTNFLELGLGKNGYTYEGIQGYVRPIKLPGTVALHRYWNVGIGDHFYTTNFAELGNGGGGWIYEGIQCYVYAAQALLTVPLYRYWNQAIGDHFYTTNFNEQGYGAN